ncbi:MAG: response regulator [bacterium]|nr:response regulator [bacterium]
MKITSGKHTVLIVDDNPANLGMLTSYLKEFGYKTPMARNGETAMIRAEINRPDIILLDVVMPGIDGFETCRRLKMNEATKAIPVIFMTARTGTEDKLKGFKVGGVDYVTKPFQQEEVLARVATHLQIRELEQSLREQSTQLEKANDEIRLLNEQLQAENIRVSENLKESEYKYQTLAEEISDGYFVIQDGVIVFANQVFCRMHGYPLHEVPGNEFALFVDPESRLEVADIYTNTRQAMSISHLFEYLRLTKDGRSVSTEMTAKTTCYENKVVDIGICRDITERLQMERRVREAERMAYIGRITTSLSHEIRNPLSAIKMNLRILQTARKFTERDWRHIDISVNEVMRLEEILDELLDFAKPLRLNMNKCTVNDTLESCLELLNVKFEQKGLVIVRALASELPVIYADPKKLSQVFLNLLLNAFDVSEAQGALWIGTRYHADEEEPCIEVAIEDEGTGISKKQFDDIFEPFVTSKRDGTGLGLTNTKRILDAHGGWIDVANRDPHGASFRVYLPV